MNLYTQLPHDYYRVLLKHLNISDDFTNTGLNRAGSYQVEHFFANINSMNKVCL